MRKKYIFTKIKEKQQNLQIFLAFLVIFLLFTNRTRKILSSYFEHCTYLKKLIPHRFGFFSQLRQAYFFAPSNSRWRSISFVLYELEHFEESTRAKRDRRHFTFRDFSRQMS